MQPLTDGDPELRHDMHQRTGGTELRHLPQDQLPNVLFVEQLAQILLLTHGGVRRALNRGEYGSFGRIGRRLFVRRETLLAALKAREVDVQWPVR